MLLTPSPESWQNLYRVLIDSVQPRPIGFISTVDVQGRANVAPYSFFNLVSANPPVCFFAASVTRTGAQKDSYYNVKEVPEFGVNIVSEDFAGKMNQAAFAYDRGVAEFEQVGLTRKPAQMIAPPLVAESLVHFECRVIEIREFGHQPGAGAVVFGEIVLVHVRDGLLTEDGRIPPEVLRTLGRMGGNTYCRTTDLFEMGRPKG